MWAEAAAASVIAAEIIAAQKVGPPRQSPKDKQPQPMIFDIGCGFCSGSAGSALPERRAEEQRQPTSDPSYLLVAFLMGGALL